MPHQLGVTIRANVAADQVPGLRKWLADTARNGVADGPFDFARMRGLHFAKLYLLEETEDLDSKPIPASLVLMTEVDAPLRRHLADFAGPTLLITCKHRHREKQTGFWGCLRGMGRWQWPRDQAGHRH